jgi:hypothetical protein
MGVGWVDGLVSGGGREQERVVEFDPRRRGGSRRCAPGGRAMRICGRMDAVSVIAVSVSVASSAKPGKQCPVHRPPFYSILLRPRNFRPGSSSLFARSWVLLFFLWVSLLLLFLFSTMPPPYPSLSDNPVASRSPMEESLSQELEKEENSDAVLTGGIGRRGNSGS